MTSINEKKMYLDFLSVALVLNQLKPHHTRFLQSWGGQAPHHKAYFFSLLEFDKKMVTALIDTQPEVLWDRAINIQPAA